MPVSALVRTRNRVVATRYGAVVVRSGAVAVAAVCAAALVGCGSQTDDASSIIRTTTNIAGAGVIGLERDTTKACALPSAPDQASGTRSVTHAAGVSEVPADPQRIVVLTTSALDATCALGLWERVVGAVTVDGERPQPTFLGTGVLKIPSVGTAAEPDLAKIAELRPDVIIGEQPSGAATLDALRAIAPTVLVGASNSWQAEFSAFAAGLDRSGAAGTALANYRTEAADIGNAIAANQSQASVVRFTGDAIQVQGSESFAGRVLADVGVQRPTAQRGASFDVAAGDFDTKVEGDVVYVVLAGESGKEQGEKVMRGDEWKELGAAGDRRVFAVEDSVWHGDGLTAARALLSDVQKTLNGYVTD
ncbi:ABC transporter substrate-binding protein [Nocardia amikacinitolerans]|uniref:ABC transporter substrate-binding protein n=1 Tax=Nocardia amikacinitolerans TaxID=756689 RepID=UPI0020A31E27|nr:ABC transporter substrate-binding protein [Nocardia amikacinitolerans]MCP2274505.1 iron complex transport system substrate-binding protein [Nocardia amikacinitolerans]